MWTKTIVRYFMVAVACSAPVWSAGGQTTVEDLANISQISDGQFTAKINGLKLWYKVSGNGPICILPTPGHGPSSELYFLNYPPLEEMFTMVYLDTRGSGRSERPELTEYTMSNFIEDIEGLRRHLGAAKIWLMGHSNGGIMVLNYAFKYPNAVTGLILVDTKVGDSSKGEGPKNHRSHRWPGPAQRIVFVV